MSKEAVPANMDDLYAAKSGRTTKAPQKTHRSTTKAPQRATEAPQKGDRGPLEKHHIRVHREDWKALQEHFEAQGIPAATGIRMIIRAYMLDKDL